MQVIGTHDSITGENGKGLLSWLVTPFARTQRKTLQQQYEAGVRFFDIRIKWNGKNWYGGHGLWTSEKTFYYIMHELRGLAEEDIFISICLENDFHNKEEEFTRLVDDMYRTFESTPVHLISAAVKLPKWRDIRHWPCHELKVKGIHHCFKTLDGRSWHTYLPIPWLWNKLYNIEPQDGTINSYDFL